MPKCFLLLMAGFFCLVSTRGQDAGVQLEACIAHYEAAADEVSTTPWPRLHPRERESRQAELAQWLADLAQISADSLSLADRINYDLLRLLIADEHFQLDFKSYTFPLNAEGGFLAGVIYHIRGVQLRSEEDLDRYLEKLQSLPTYFRARIADMRHGLAIGKVHPQLIVNNCVQLIDHFLAIPVADNFFVRVANTEPERSAILELVEKEVLPAYRDLRDFLVRDYLPQAPAAIGVSEMTDGKTYYEQRVAYYTTFAISPQEVFDQGMAEVARIRAEMEAILAEVGFAGSFAEFLNFLRTDPQFYCDDPQCLLDRAAWITTKAQGQLPRFFGQLPRMPLDVVPVPPALAPNYTGGRYSPGSYETGRSGQYWVNTLKLDSRPLYVLPALTLHEGVPGHHLQIMLAAEMEELPDFRGTYLSAFGEGWGLYAEHLGQEMGIYTTPYEQFGRLTYEMWRACRLVVDPGMHYLGWSRQEAVDFMSKNTALSMHEVNTEIDRYIGWPGQAVSYKMGELKIKALRAQAEEALGAGFNIREFHDLILQNGSVPLESLQRVVESYLDGE